MLHDFVESFMRAAVSVRSVCQPHMCVWPIERVGVVVCPTFFPVYSR